MVHVVAAIELGIFVDDRLITDLELAPHADLPFRQLAPSALVFSPAVVGPPMRNGFFDRRPYPTQIIRQLIRAQRRLHRHHAAADIHSDRRRNNRALGRNHTPHRRSDPPMHIRHRRHPFINKRQSRHIAQLLLRHRLDGNALGPGFDRNAVFGFDQLIRFFHGFKFTAANAAAKAR